MPIGRRLETLRHILWVLSTVAMAMSQTARGKYRESAIEPSLFTTLPYCEATPHSHSLAHRWPLHLLPTHNQLSNRFC